MGTVGRDSKGFYAQLKRNGQTHKKRAGSRAEAERLRQEMVYTQQAIKYDTPLTVLLGSWLTSRVPHLSDSAQTCYANAIRHISEVVPADLPCDIQAQRVERIYADLARKGLSLRMLEECHKVLRMAYSRAIKRGDLQDNPILLADPPPKPQRKPIEIFAQWEVEAILEHSGYWRPAIWFAFNTGLRRAELFALKWDDFHGQVCLVQGQVKERPSIHRADYLKTASARRRVAVDEMVLPPRLQEEWVFPSKTGRLMSPHRFLSRDWKAILQSAKVEYRGLHAIRHAFCVQALRDNPVHVVARIMGHSQPSTTLNTYSHLVEGDELEVASKVFSRWTKTERSDP